ncbi:MAG: hypothetical protein R3F02_11385 [Thiolinea sp.]
MNDAKGHASALLVLSLISVLAVAAAFIWALNQSSFFNSSFKSADIPSRPTTVAGQTSANIPIRMPEIKATKPEQTTTPETEVTAQTQKPETPAPQEETQQVTAEPETIEATADQEKTEQATAEPEITETPAPREEIQQAAVIPEETALPQEETQQATAEPETIETPAPQEETQQATAEPETIEASTPQEEIQEAAAEPESTQETGQRTKNGWIYAGQYKNGQWIERGLELPDTQLPDLGDIYKLIWGSNVRVAPPGKRKEDGSNLAKNIDYLAENSQVEITDIKNSGQSGHIWLEIRY